ncbi:MAG: 4-amino-4-deoxychorismate lyase, partial [Pedobacter sp.]
AGMKALKMDGGNLLDNWFLKQKTAELSKKNKLLGNARFRLSIFRSGAGLYTPDINRSEYLLESSPTEGGYTYNSKGLIIDVYTDLPKPINGLSNYKTTNALTYVMAGLYKKQQALDEAILLNQNGFICEAISANVFIVYNKQLYTPSLAEGCIAGVMRNVTLQLAKKNGLTVTEAQINPEVLNEAEEIFITNASTGIRWVMGYGRKRYFNEISKFLSGKLNELK